MKLLDTFVHFSQRQYDCLDYDPFHPLLWYMGRHLGLIDKEALWLSTLYMAFYNIGSAYVAFVNGDPWKELPDWVLKLPIGVQRRNLRGGKVREHLLDFSRQALVAGGPVALLTQGFTDQPAPNWRALQTTLDGVWGNGRWSNFTLGELYQKVNHLPVLPTDIMNDGSSGPRAGLAYLCEVDPELSVEELDKVAARLFKKVRPRISTDLPYMPHNHYDYGMLESQLCDFNSLRKGRYYIGRDIDRDQERILATHAALEAMGQDTKRLDEVWAAREACFAKEYLGEFSGWIGRTQLANEYYLRTKRVADHRTIRENEGVLV